MTSESSKGLSLDDSSGGVTASASASSKRSLVRGMLVVVLLTALLSTHNTVYWENQYEQRVAKRLSAKVYQSDVENAA